MIRTIVSGSALLLDFIPIRHLHRTPRAGCEVYSMTRSLTRVCALLLATASPVLHGAVTDKIPPAIPLKAQPFEPRDVRLLDGPFKQAMELDAKWLLSLEPDRLLAWYRKEAGLEPKAPNYGSWESQGIAGHSLGHYLTACARMDQASGDRRFRERVNYIVDELADCQQSNSDGFLGAMPNGKRVFAEVARGEIRSAGFDLNGSWVPWYNLHKLFAGLIDAHRYCANGRALEVVSRLGDWADETTKNLTVEQWQKMLACEYGGMNESLADLYALTGEKKYLALARKFYDKAVLDPLAAGRDELPGKHANTQIPKAIGAARIYELTDDAPFGAIARNFYHIVLTNHTYVNGGNSDGEHFGPSGRLNNRLGLSTAETCNTYNMLKLARALFTHQPDAAYADYYERGLLNQILASQHPEDGRVTYFLTLRPGEHRRFVGPHDFTCCNGTGMENHARYGDSIYFRADDALWVNLFIASELNWAAKGLRLRQETEFPVTPRTTLKFTAETPLKLKLHVRQPFWATNGFAVRLNGKKVDLPNRPASYAIVERTWANGDTLEVEMPFSLRTESMPDNPNRIAIFHGPVLLAGDVGPVGSTTPVPVLVTDDRPVTAWVKPIAGQPLAFRTEGVGRPGDVALKPFYGAYEHRHSVYWDIFTQAAWKVREAEYKAELQRIKDIEARTVALFRIGEMQPERDHDVHGEKTDAVEFAGRKLRHAYDGGWFSFRIAVPANAPADLVITYWGSETGRRTFDVLVEGQKIATTSLHRDKPEQFWDKIYPLPEHLTSGRSTVTVKFQAHPGNFAGGVFGVRVVRRGD